MSQYTDELLTRAINLQAEDASSWKKHTVNAIVIIGECLNGDVGHKEVLPELRSELQGARSSYDESESKVGNTRLLIKAAQALYEAKNNGDVPPNVLIDAVWNLSYALEPYSDGAADLEAAITAIFPGGL